MRYAAAFLVRRQRRESDDDAGLAPERGDDGRERTGALIEPSPLLLERPRHQIEGARVALDLDVVDRTDGRGVVRRGEPNVDHARFGSICRHRRASVLVARECRSTRPVRWAESPGFSRVHVGPPPLHFPAWSRQCRVPKGAPASGRDCFGRSRRVPSSRGYRQRSVFQTANSGRRAADRPCSSVAEHLHGKEGVAGSIPAEGSTKRSGSPGREPNPWRRSSVGQSIRLIIGRSSVQVRSPLPEPEQQLECQSKFIAGVRRNHG